MAELRCWEGTLASRKRKAPATVEGIVASSKRKAPATACSFQSVKTFPFKELPREIRDKIYDYVFESSDADLTVTAFHTFSPRRTYRTYTSFGSPQDPQVMLALLSVDRQILNEGVQSFYSRRAFCIGLREENGYANQFLEGIGRQRLDLIRTIIYSVTLFSEKDWDKSAQWHQLFRSPTKTLWRETFGRLRSACGLRTLVIDLGMTPVSRRGPTPSEWAELESCLVGIKGRVDLFVCNRHYVFVQDNVVECEGMTTETTLQTNYWTCKKGETEWSPMESLKRVELYHKVKDCSAAKSHPLGKRESGG